MLDDDNNNNNNNNVLFKHINGQELHGINIW